MSKPYSAAELDAVERTWAEGWLPVKHPVNCPCEHHRLIATVRDAWERFNLAAAEAERLTGVLDTQQATIGALEAEVTKYKALHRHNGEILQGPTPRAVAERVIAQHEEARDNAKHWEKLDDELCTACGLAHMVLRAEAFKAYVHERLDEAGVSKSPGGPHSDAGCRIGDRLDIALATHAEVERLRAALEKIARTRYGLQGILEDGGDDKAVAAYFSRITFDLEGMARAALAAPGEREERQVTPKKIGDTRLCSDCGTVHYPGLCPGEREEAGR